jgi:hypothetical protein
MTDKANKAASGFAQGFADGFAGLRKCLPAALQWLAVLIGMLVWLGLDSL